MLTFLEKFLASASQAYKSDESAPGITIAWLRDKQCWYASLCRYRDGKTKWIAAKGYSVIGADHCICILASAWAATAKAPAIAKKLGAFKCVRDAIKKVMEDL